MFLLETDFLLFSSPTQILPKTSNFEVKTLWLKRTAFLLSGLISCHAVSHGSLCLGLLWHLGRAAMGGGLVSGGEAGIAVSDPRAAGVNSRDSSELVCVCVL